MARFDCRLTADFHNRSGGLIQADRLYLTAQARCPAGVPPSALCEIVEPAEGDWVPFQLSGRCPDLSWADLPRLASAAMCHENRERGDDRGVAAGRPGRGGSGAGWTIPSCVLDSALYACAMHLWCVRRQRRGPAAAHGRFAIGPPAARRRDVPGSLRLPRSGRLATTTSTSSARMAR